MTRLAIKGHATRGKEVIELLEMMGGKQFESYLGNDISWCYTIINGEIDWDYPSDKYKVFTLEEFLKEFPYKVGDKVIAYVEGCLAQFTIQGMRWNDELNKVEYKICSSWLDASLMQIYKEETMEEQKKDYEEWFQTDYLEFENNDDTWADEVEVNLGKDYEIQIRGDKTFIVKKKPQYPKTYGECCKVLDWNHRNYDRIGYKSELLYKLQVLLLCRDAYWKIAGKQMDLGKHWHQDYNDRCFIITNKKGNIHTYEYHGSNNVILAFPTREMSNAFYENFKDLIEACKELL